MSSSSSSAVEHSDAKAWKNWERAANKGCGKSNWSGFNIAAMVIGFVFFWPVGLVILFWIMSGRNVQSLPGAIKRKWSATFGGGSTHSENSGNSVFNAFQQTQYDRISEIKEEIKERARRFSEYRADAKRRADEEEFNQFMAKKPAKSAE